MSRSRSTAKQAGTTFETWTGEYLAEALGDDRIERRARSGGKDRGDLTGIRTLLGDRVVVEVKNVARLDLAGWITEAAVEAGNDDAAVGVVVHKRRSKGRAQMGDQYVTMRLADFAVLLGGNKGEN